MLAALVFTPTVSFTAGTKSEALYNEHRDLFVYDGQPITEREFTMAEYYDFQVELSGQIPGLKNAMVASANFWGLLSPEARARVAACN
jgi:hypothetical protein